MRRADRHGEDAQALVEFAFIAVALIFVFSGVVDFSRFMYYDTAISSASRVAAELGGNPCETSFDCGRVNTTATASNDFVLQAAHCEAAPYVQLSPAIDCNQCTLSLCASGDPCASPPCANCTQDVCVARNPSGAPSSGQQITVWIGYNFSPISPILGQFFLPRPCWRTTDGAPTSDSSTHTICVESVGRVF